MSTERFNDLSFVWDEDLPPAPAEPEPATIGLPGIEFVKMALSSGTRPPGTWAKVTDKAIEQPLATRVAFTMRRTHHLEAVVRPLGQGWGVWARTQSEAAPPTPPEPTRAAAEPAPSDPPAPRASAQQTAPQPPPAAPSARAAAEPETDAPVPPAVSAQAGPVASDPTPVDVAAVRARLSAFVPGVRGVARERADLDYALLAEQYVMLLAEGRSPAQELADALGLSASSVISKFVREAIRRGLLTPSPYPRRPGGELTDAARDLLASLDAAVVARREAERAPEPQEEAKEEAPPLAPTPEQQREIDALNLANAIHESALRTRGYAGPIATLPDTCSPVKVSELADWLREPAQWAVDHGWAIGRQGNGHLRWVSPSGMTTAVSSTPHANARQPILAQLRSVGVNIPPRPKGGQAAPAVDEAPAAPQGDRRWPDGVGVGDCTCAEKGIGKPRWFHGCPIHAVEPDRAALAAAGKIAHAVPERKRQVTVSLDEARSVLAVPSPALRDAAPPVAERSRVATTRLSAVPDEQPPGWLEMARANANGLPSHVPIDFSDDVLALYGVDRDAAVAAVRHPSRVELDTTYKARDYPVLRMYAGDLFVVLGFKTPAKPRVIGVYVQSMLDGERSGHTSAKGAAGTGGTRKQAGLPRTPTVSVRRLRAHGVEVAWDEDSPAEVASAEVTYQGQSLGKITTATGTSKAQVESDYQRIVRKVSAMRMREAKVG